MKFLPRALSLIICIAASTVFAQFNGPAPLAWRWAASTVALPKGSPVIDGNTIYLSMGDRIYALDSVTGNQIWRFPKAVANLGILRQMPTLVNGVLVVMTDTGYAVGIDAKTGVQKWQHYIAKPTLGVPVAVGKTVVFTISDNSIIAIDSETGNDFWTEPIMIDDGISGPAVGFQDLVILFTGGANLTAYNIATKARVWQTKFSRVDSTSIPVLLGDTIYVNSGTFLAAVRAFSGTGKWQIDMEQTAVFPPMAAINSIIEVTRDGKLMSFDLNGHKNFPRPLQLAYFPAVQPTPLGEYIMVPGGNGSLNLISGRTGESSWSFVMKPIAKILNREAGASTRYVDFVAAAAPAVMVSNSLLVLANDGSLLAFDKALGVDLTPPVPSMVFPNPGDQVSGQPPLTIAFTLADEASGVDEKTVFIELDGKPVTFEKTKEHFYLIRISSNGKVRPLGDGRHVFTLHSADWLGNAGSKSFTLMVDNSLRPVGVPGEISIPGGGGGGGRGGGGGGGGRGGGG